MPLDWIKGFYMDGPVITARRSSCRTRQLAGCWSTSGWSAPRRREPEGLWMGWNLGLPRATRHRFKAKARRRGTQLRRGIECMLVVESLHGMQVPNSELFFHSLSGMLLRGLEREAFGCWPFKTSTMHWG
jgi:hypothetical protein